MATSSADIDLVMVYCVVFERWREAEAMIDKHGMVFTAKNGSTYQSPYVRSPLGLLTNLESSARR